MSKKKFNIPKNLGASEIKEFIDFYKEALDKKGNGNSDDYLVNVIFNPTINDSDINGEVDPVYLSYIALFLKDFKNSSIEFKFLNYEKSNRAYSLKFQLEYIRYTFNFNKTRIKLYGKTRDSEGKDWNINLYPYTEKIIQSTGEILNTKKNIDNYYLKQSQSFIPPIYIDGKKRTIDKYFIKWNSLAPDIRNSLKILCEKICSKIETTIGDKGFETDERKTNISHSYIDELELHELSFIELSLYNLLTSPQCLDHY